MKMKKSFVEELLMKSVKMSPIASQQTTTQLSPELEAAMKRACDLADVQDRIARWQSN